MRRVLPLLLLLALASSAACESKPRPRRAPAATAVPVSIRVQLPAEPPHLNPLLGSDLSILQVVMGDVYQPLYELDDDGGVRPVLAERVDVAADGLSFTFTLRDGVTWHDGHAFGVDDVLFTMKLLAPGGAATPLAAEFDDAVAVERTGERSVRIRFAGFRVSRLESFTLVPMLPAHVFAGVAPAELAAHPASRAPVGTGPYVFDGWTPGRELRLRAREELLQAGQLGVASVVYRVIADRTQAVEQLRAGELDLLLALPPGPLLDQVAADKKVQLLPFDASTFLAVRWNCRPGPLADARVRRALTMTLDRRGVVDDLLGGRGMIASAPWWPDDPAYDATIAPWPFDPDAARRLLAEAGQPDLHVALLLPAGSVTLERIATVWREDALRAGVTLELVPDPSPIERARRGDFQAVAYAWSTGREQDFYHHLHTSQAGAENYGACGDAELDALLEAVRREADPVRRAALEHQVHRRLHDAQPLTVISLDRRVAAASLRITGLFPGPRGVPIRRIRSGAAPAR